MGKKCANKECGKEFVPKYSSLEKYCSSTCKFKCIKPNKKTIGSFGSKRNKIQRLSGKRKNEEAQYLRERVIFLEKPENKVCPVTGGRTTDVHHKKGRIGSLLLDQRFWLAVSRNGHKWIEENPIEAKERGWSLSRLAKD